MLAAAGGAAAAQTKEGEPAPAPSSLQKLAQDCDAHKFETLIDGTVDGKPKKSRMRLCGVEGQSDEAWLTTLKDAIAKTVANDKMPAAMREQIITALSREITRLEALQPKVAARNVPAPPPTPAPTPLPPPRPAPVAAAPLTKDFTPLPPLPTTPTVATSSMITPSVPLLPRPRLSINCMTPGEMAGEGPCTEFTRNTFVTVRAGEDLPFGTGIRFVRDDERADVQLAQLKRGKSVSFELPRAVCQGVGGGRLELNIMRSAPNAAAQVVGREGPFNLRC